MCAASNKGPPARRARGQPLDTSMRGLALPPERALDAMEGLPGRRRAMRRRRRSGGTWEFDDRVAREALGSIGATFKIDDK